MRFRLALALLVSVLLIGGTSWHRLKTTKNVSPNILAVEQFRANSEDYEDILQEFVGPNPHVASSTAPTKPLSNTDLIGRRLVLDYIDLAASGQATEASISALANRYVESIPTLNKASTISYTDIQTTSNSKINLQNYADKFEEIHQEYAGRVSEAYRAENNPRGLNPATYSFLSTFSGAYTDAASKLKNMSVPLSLVPLHLQLVNSYLSSATAMLAITKNEEDPAVAFAGLINLNGNLDKEDVLLSEIARILNLNGI